MSLENHAVSTSQIDSTPTAAPSAPAFPDYLNVSGIVSYLQGRGMTTATKTFARSLLNCGELPYLKIGKGFFVSKKSVDLWLERRERRRR